MRILRLSKMGVYGATSQDYEHGVDKIWKVRYLFRSRCSKSEVDKKKKMEMF